MHIFKVRYCMEALYFYKFGFFKKIKFFDQGCKKLFLPHCLIGI